MRGHFAYYASAVTVSRLRWFATVSASWRKWVLGEARQCVVPWAAHQTNSWHGSLHCFQSRAPWATPPRAISLVRTGCGNLHVRGVRRGTATPPHLLGIELAAVRRGSLECLPLVEAAGLAKTANRPAVVAAFQPFEEQATEEAGEEPERVGKKPSLQAIQSARHSGETRLPGR